MEKRLFAGLVLIIVALMIWLGLTIRENHKLQREIEGYSDQVMKLEQMLELE